MASSSTTPRETAQRFAAAGLSVIPVRPDGSKAAALPSWKPFQSRIATPVELSRMFSNGAGLAVIGGAVSGGLEVLDFETGADWPEYSELLETHAPGLLARLVHVQTPTGGRHVYYRCRSAAEGNQKLAMREGLDGRPKVLIETRGEGGYVLSVGSPAACHPLGKEYRLLHGDLTAVPAISEDERGMLLACARSFNSYTEPKRAHIGAMPSGNRPGDDFNRRASWREILEAAGWKRVGKSGERDLWQRPGKKQGISATSNYGGSELLYVFSTNAHPFEHDTSYSKFFAYSLLNHDGDLKAAARALAADGYGDKAGAHPDSTESATVHTAEDCDLRYQPQTDTGNAERMLMMFGADMRWCVERKLWFLWDGCRWRADQKQESWTLAKRTLRRLYEQAATMPAGEFRDGLEKHARKSEQAKGIRDMLACAAHEPELVVSISEFDQQPFLLNVGNGTVDARTGEIQPHTRQHLITKLIPYRYLPDEAGNCPMFLAFLRRIMGFDENQSQPGKATRLMGYLQKAIGYSMTAATSEKAVFLLHGPGGDNGKSTFLYLFFLLLGEYASQLQIDSLMTRQESNNSQADLADLHGARFVITSETEKGQRLAEGKLKRITQGMGTIRAVRKYENPFSFPETHKLWIDANHRPVVKGTDDAIWNRLHLVPFDIRIPKAEQVQRFHERLIEAEGEAILAWAIEGAKQWHQEGLGKPEEITNAVSDWRKESNSLKDFVADRLEIQAGNDTYAASIADVWKAYMLWCDVNRQKAKPRTEFNEQLEALGAVRDRTDEARIWAGVRLCG